jgi:hypothetical protein
VLNISISDNEKYNDQSYNQKIEKDIQVNNESISKSITLKIPTMRNISSRTSPKTAQSKNITPFGSQKDLRIDNIIDVGKHTQIIV